MDSGKSTDTESATIQPDDAVVADLEATEAKPQAEDTEEIELYVEEETSNQQKPVGTMTQAQAYAAFQKEKNKRKDKQLQIDAEKAEKERLQNELDALKKTVSTISRGEMPDPYDFEDKHKYYEALKKWEGGAEPAKQEVTQNQPVSNPVNDENDFYLYQSEQAITKVLPDYSAMKTNVEGVFRQLNINPDQAISYLSGIAKQKGVDITKAIVAINKNPSIAEDLLSAGANQFLIGDILEGAANKVKTRSRKPIDTKPEPEVNNSGPVNSFGAEVEAARQAWVKSPNLTNHAKYKQAKAKAKAGQTKGK